MVCLRTKGIIVVGRRARFLFKRLSPTFIASHVKQLVLGIREYTQLDARLRVTAWVDHTADPSSQRSSNPPEEPLFGPPPGPLVASAIHSRASTVVCLGRLARRIHATALPPDIPCTDWLAASPAPLVWRQPDAGLTAGRRRSA